MPEKRTYPFGGAQRAVPALELFALWVILALGLGAGVEFEITSPAMFRLIRGRESRIARSGANLNGYLRHVCWVGEIAVTLVIMTIVVWLAVVWLAKDATSSSTSPHSNSSTQKKNPRSKSRLCKHCKQVVHRLLFKFPCYKNWRKFFETRLVPTCNTWQKHDPIDFWQVSPSARDLLFFATQSIGSLYCLRLPAGRVQFIPRSLLSASITIHLSPAPSL